MPKPRAPKFKVGQVVGVKYAGSHFWSFEKIAKVFARCSHEKPTSPHCYLLVGRTAALSEKDLRAQTKREAGRG